LTGTVVVVGAGGGIGSVVASQLFADGRSVYLVDRDAVSLERVAHSLGNARMHTADLLDADSLEAALSEAASNGPLSAVVNAAGIGPMQAADGVDVLRTNLEGPALLCDLSRPHIEEGGSCVLVGSVASSRAPLDADLLLIDPLRDGWASRWTSRGVEPWDAYAYAKRGLVLLARRLAVAWGRDGRRINVVSPVVVQTTFGLTVLSASDNGVSEMARQIPMGRICQPSDIAEAVAFLISDRASFINGIELRIDGGSTAAGLHVRQDVPAAVIA
jgi:NAD(P)-dependent dehydrogenase (short-subunit alcohol dehydrogenase family)